MAITNGYATLDQFKALPDIASVDASDDSFIESIIERASRIIDGKTGGRTFYARSETRYFDAGDGRELIFDDDLIEVTTLTNGDGAVIASSNYHLLPKNSPPYYGLRLKENSSVVWLPDANGNDENAISIAGKWGYVDRAATDAASVRVVTNTTAACLSIALGLYQERQGAGVAGVARITATGVVIAPQGIPLTAQNIIDLYTRTY